MWRHYFKTIKHVCDKIIINKHSRFNIILKYVRSVQCWKHHQVLQVQQEVSCLLLYSLSFDSNSFQFDKLEEESQHATQPFQLSAME